jgi:hypothetical protein
LDPQFDRSRLNCSIAARTLVLICQETNIAKANKPMDTKERRFMTALFVCVDEQKESALHVNGLKMIH